MLDVDAVRAYRTLKFAMEQVRSRSEEAIFFALEQKSLRARKETPSWIKLFSWLYEKTADYGQSFVRPLGSLLFIFILFFFIYTVYIADPFTWSRINEGWRLEWTTDSVTWRNAACQAWQFSLEQVFIPFKVFQQAPAKSDPPRLLAAIHSLLTLSFLALFLLALRRRFKLD